MPDHALAVVPATPPPTPDAEPTLLDCAVPAVTVAGRSTVPQLARRFDEHPELRCVVVRRSDGAVGVLMRDGFERLLAGAGGCSSPAAAGFLAGDLVAPATVWPAETPLVEVVGETPGWRSGGDLVVSTPDGDLATVPLTGLVAELAAQVRARSTHDPRTGLLDHRGLLIVGERLQAARAERPEVVGVVVAVVGDRAVDDPRRNTAAVARLADGLRSLTRRADLLARTGDHELTVVTAPAEVAGLETLARRIRYLASTSTGDDPGGVPPVSVGLSIGPATSPLAELVDRARRAERHARSSGSGRWSWGAEAPGSDTATAGLPDRYVDVLDDLDDPVCRHLADGTITWANRGYVRRAGVADHRDLVGSSFFPWLSPEALAAAQRMIAKVFRGEVVTYENTGVVGDPDLIVRWVCRPVPGPDGRIAEVQAAGHDVTALVRARSALERTVHYDHLTGLPNRTTLVDRLSRPPRSAATRALLVVDLDEFGVIDDQHGREIADEVLVRTARRLGTVADDDDDDVVARIDGDQFAVVRSVPEAETVGDLAERVLRLVREPVAVGTAVVTLTATIGATVIPGAALDRGEADQAIRDAWLAMVHAHAGGNDRWAGYQPRLREQLDERRSIRTALREAIEHDELRLHYQPILELGSREVRGVEALLRWTTADGLDVSPAQFVPIAEQSSMIVALTDWVLDRAAADTAELLDEALPDGARVWVNLSASEIGADDLSDRVLAALRRHAVPEHRIGVEVTESAVFPDDAGLRQLVALRAAGVAVALDDFGTGHSSLSHLQRLPLDVVKVDRSFVSGIVDRPLDLAIVSSVLSIAWDVGLTVVAEGVETAEQERVLEELGCHRVMGWRYAPALEPRAVAGFVRTLAPGAGADDRTAETD